jgi:opacity protein-like surface antigen
MKRLKINTVPILAASFFALAASSANASDLLDGLNEPAPQGTAVNWTGFYIGGYGGYGIGTYSGEDKPLGISFESPILSANAGFDIARDRFVFGPFVEYTYITADEAEDVTDWAAGVRAGVVVAPRTLLYGSIAYAQLSDDDESVDGLRAGLGTEFAISGNLFVDTKVNYTWYDLEELNDHYDAGDLRALVGLKIKLNGDLGGF